MKKENIIFICTDQHRQDSLKCYNKDTLCKTPVLDELSSESMVFDNAYTSCPVCTPARSSMQCGLFPSVTGMETNSFQTGCRTHEIQDTPLLLSRRLNKKGYNCLYTGKWHLGVGGDKRATGEGRSLLNALTNVYEMDVAAYEHYGTLPTSVGYKGDDFPGHGNGGWHYPQFQQYLKDNNLDLIIENTTGKKKPGDHSTFGEVKSPIESTIEYFLVNRSIELIEENKDEDKPFFLNLNFWGPHEPFFAPTEYLNQYKDLKIPQWESFNEDPSTQPRIYEMIRRPEQNWDFFETTLRHYYACITHIDNQIGRLIKYLKANDLYDNTTIILSADHGDYQGVHGKMENKSYGMYDDITKVPLIIKPSKTGYKGSSKQELVGTCDIYATILDLADIKGNYGNGKSLKPFLENEAVNWENEVVTEGMGADNIIVTQRMYRKDNIKYVFNGADKDQLFDLEKDPNELNNLVQKDPELLNEMKLSFAAWLKKNSFDLYSSFCRINRINEWSLS